MHDLEPQGEKYSTSRHYVSFAPSLLQFQPLAQLYYCLSNTATVK